MTQLRNLRPTPSSNKTLSGTTMRALGALKALGLVLWQRRLVRAGWRVAQTSNSYVLVPAEVRTLPTFPAPRCGGQNVRETLQESFTLPPASAEAVADARAALARRRAAVGAMPGQEGKKIQQYRTGF